MSNLLLFCMCICYCIPILYVYSNYDSNASLSHIICNENITNVILYSWDEGDTWEEYIFSN